MSLLVCAAAGTAGCATTVETVFAVPGVALTLLLITTFAVADELLLLVFVLLFVAAGV
jgi:ABC-type dipeptide/oligopeptide/nickel transport system permease component